MSWSFVSHNFSSRIVLALSIAVLAPAVALGGETGPTRQGQERHGLVSVLDVLSIYRDLNDMCLTRSGDGVHTHQACNTREKVARLLNGMGYCYGGGNEDAAHKQWHKCATNELF